MTLARYSTRRLEPGDPAELRSLRLRTLTRDRDGIIEIELAAAALG